MNISRSGRVRKRSNLLADSEFYTPKHSVIYGLSSSASKSIHEPDELTEEQTKPGTFLDVNSDSTYEQLII